MSVLFGRDFSDILMLDIDDQPPGRDIEGVAARISHRWDLGDCLIVISSVDETSVNYHLVYDRILSWLQVHAIVVQLAREGEIDRRLVELSTGRGDLTLRLSPDRANGRMAPFPIGYVRCHRLKFGYRGGGIKKWLEAWKIARKISRISFNSPRIARIARK